MSLEIELKYRIKEPSKEIEKILLSEEKFGDYSLGEIENKEIVDVYYDTADYKISKSKSILRVRVENYHNFYLTIKTTIKVDDAKFVREEIEEAISEEFVKQVHSKLEEFGMQLKEFDRFDYLQYGIWGLFKMWDLREIFVCENSRRIRNIYDKNNQQIAELSFDNVLISTFGKKDSFKEIEIEQKNNSDEFVKLHEFIDKNIENHLIKGQKSKFETGINLLFGDKLESFDLEN